VIRVLLRQLLDQLGKIPNDVRNEYSRYRNDPHKIMPDRDKYTSMLKGSIEEFFKAKQNRIFILVDAYDELLSSKEEKLERVTAERVAVRSCLAKLTETENAKVLITTRFQHREELKQSFIDSNIVDIHGELKDMRIYLEIRIGPLDLQDPLKVEIIETILEKNAEEKW
jgi:predicted metalloendopeptidase